MSVFIDNPGVAPFKMVDMLSCRVSTPSTGSTPTCSVACSARCEPVACLSSDGLTHGMPHLDAFCPGLQCLRCCGSCLFGHTNELDAGGALSGDRCGVCVHGVQ